MTKQPSFEPVNPAAESEWDRSGNWTILRTHRTTYRVAVLVAPLNTVRQLVAIRQMCEIYRNMPPSQFRNEIVDGKVPLGDISPAKISHFKSLAISLGLTLDVQTISLTTEDPYEKTRNIFLMIDDDAQRQRIVCEMLAAGVPVEIAEAD